MDEWKRLHDEQTVAQNQPVDVEIDGFVLTEKYLQHKDLILDFEVRDSDIWVCSFPKTGTTWTQEMVWLLSNNLDYKGATAGLDDRFPFLELTAMYNKFSVPSDIADGQGLHDDSVDFIRNLKNRRLIKTHLPWNFLPKQIQDGSKKPKIIYITRNPMDTCVSYYNHHRIFAKISYEFEIFCELFLADKLELTPFWGHLLGFWEKRKCDNVLFLKYEDLKKDLSAVIQEVADFLDVQITEEEVKRLRDHLSFDSMKNNDAVNYKNYVQSIRDIGLTDYQGEFMRSGTTGSYKKSMSPEMIERFKKWTKEKTNGTGFHFYNNL